ncbi:MAG: radical SAM protein [Verrucomicrobia bacterium]|nr:radical SAM protein [Verrucomicrobiota bacterium]
MKEADKNALLKSIAGKFPSRTIIVELTNGCNLDCPLCSTGSGFNKKPKGMMKLEDFKRFMDQVSPLVDSVIFSGSGEPLLHPQFFEFVAYAVKEKGKMATCLSNGTRLTKPYEIVRSRLTKIQVDVNGLTQEQHATYRVGSDLEKVLHNIRELVSAKKELHAAYPLVYMDVLISRYNEKDHEGFIKLARELKVNGVILSAIRDDLFYTKDWQPRDERFAPKKRLDGPMCDFKNTLVGILSWDGDIQLCCMTPNYAEPISRGNAFQTGNVLELLDSERFLEITRKCGSYPCCETCFPRDFVGHDRTINFKLPLRYVLKKLQKEPGRIFKKLLRGGFALKGA